RRPDVYGRATPATAPPAEANCYSLPATLPTNWATSCASLPSMIWAGIVPCPRQFCGSLVEAGFWRQPLLIVRSTSEAGGFSVSRFGPTLPLVLPAASV